MIISSMISSTLKLLAASLVLWAPVFTPADVGHISKDTTSLTVSNRALEIACEYTKWDCVGTPAPHVDYSYYVGIMGWLGAYSYTSDPDGVWLNPYFLGELVDPESVDTLAFAILIHETVHYLDYHLNGPFPSACATESLAWSVTLTWLDRSGNSNVASEFRNWRDWYGCNAPNEEDAASVIQ